MHEFFVYERCITQNIYVVEQAAAGSYRHVSARIGPIVPAPHDSDSLATAIPDALNNGKSVAGSYTVPRATSNSTSTKAVGSAAFCNYRLEVETSRSRTFKT